MICDILISKTDKQARDGSEEQTAAGACRILFCCCLNKFTNLTIICALTTCNWEEICGLWYLQYWPLENKIADEMEKKP